MTHHTTRIPLTMHSSTTRLTPHHKSHRSNSIHHTSHEHKPTSPSTNPHSCVSTHCPTTALFRQFARSYCDDPPAFHPSNATTRYPCIHCQSHRLSLPHQRNSMTIQTLLAPDTAIYSVPSVMADQLPQTQHPPQPPRHHHHHRLVPRYFLLHHHHHQHHHHAFIFSTTRQSSRL